MRRHAPETRFSPNALGDAEERVRVDGITWAQYDSVARALGDEHPGVRLAYLEGALEITSPSAKHETRKSLIGRLVEAYAEERDIPLDAYGSTTFRVKAKARGVEPDECYRRAGARPARRGPDLAIEVALTSWRVDRFAIYAGLGVRELWIWRQDRLEMYSLRGRTYVRVPSSPLLPGLDPVLLRRFIRKDDQTRAVRELRALLRKK